MGMLGEITCKMPLPGSPPAFVGPSHAFQTKDLECFLKEYEITADGRLTERGSAVPFTGELRFYTSNMAGAWGRATYTRNGEDAESVEYVATCQAGRVREIREESHTVQAALPVARMRQPTPAPTAEDVARWKARRAESLMGRTVYVLWGGQENGYAAEVVAEGKQKLAVRVLTAAPCHPVGELELLDRAGRDSTFFDSEAEARARRRGRQDEADAAMAEYDAYAREWKAKREPAGAA